MITNRCIRRGVRAAVLAVGLGAVSATPALAIGRSDGATELPITGIGKSFQNPCWGPGSDHLVFTQYTDRYNTGSSIARVASFPNGALTARLSPLPTAGNPVDAVNEPGSCWSAAKNLVAYSGSDASGTDQIVAVRPDGTGAPLWVTGNLDSKLTAWEPSFSPDGRSLVFEAHLLCANHVSAGCQGGQQYSDQGTIWKIGLNGKGLTQLTCPSASFADQQPNWAPTNSNLVVFQRNTLDGPGIVASTDLYTMNPNRLVSCRQRQLTAMTARWTTATAGSSGATAGQSSDASFSPDSSQIVYSGSTPNMPGGLSHIYLLDVVNDAPPQPVTTAGGVYDGAPSYSRDGTIAFESSPGGSDGSPGTRIWTIPAP